MRVAIAGIIHESNTFSPTPTELTDFRIETGDRLIERWRQAHHELSGFIAGAEQFDFDIYPTLAATAVPGGQVTAAAFETLTQQLLSLLRDAPPLDGLLLALHGAMVADGYADADGEIAARVRTVLGPDVPIVTTYDLHANISERAVQATDILLSYKTNPHIDQRDRGMQAAELLAGRMRGAISPEQALRKPPLLLNIRHHNTSAEPIRSVMQAARDLEAQPGVLAVSIALGYQYADIPDMGPSVLVVTDGDRARAEREAERLAAMIWQRRDQLQVNLPDAAMAIRQARSSAHTPVVLVDMGDNIGGGSAGDSTFVLNELLRQEVEGWVVVLRDPEAVRACADAGIGATVTLPVGGKTDEFHGPPVTVSGRVKCLHDGQYVETEPRHGGRFFHDQGLTAVLELPADHGNVTSLLVLTTNREAPMSLHQLLSVGIQPRRQKILVVKAAIAYRAAYEPIAGTIIEVDTPGLTAVNPARFTYRHVCQPLWGLADTGTAR